MFRRQKESQCGIGVLRNDGVMWWKSVATSICGSVLFLMTRIRNEEIRKELEAEAVNSRMDRYRKRWLQHVGRMEDTRLPKLAFQYAPKGKRDVGRPRTRWKETL
ncbi:hypothetical protein C0J52_12682 [Blattella germanica]|nr:hypothetical protein C0J52_12682 [Blattella germanica]